MRSRPLSKQVINYPRRGEPLRRKQLLSDVLEGLELERVSRRVQEK